MWNILSELRYGIELIYKRNVRVNIFFLEFSLCTMPEEYKIARNIAATYSCLKLGEQYAKVCGCHTASDFFYLRADKNSLYTAVRYDQ